MYIIHVKEPVGRYFKVVDMYIRPPMDIPVRTHDRLRLLKRSLRAQGLRFTVERVKTQSKTTKKVTAKDRVKVDDEVEIKVQYKSDEQADKTEQAQNE